VGFFYEQASSTLQWSRSTLESLDLLAPNDLVVEVGGSYKYYCYVLANFDPLRAQELEATCSIEDITKAVMARVAYYRPKEER
jgi:hypothetical protein